MGHGDKRGSGPARIYKGKPPDLSWLATGGVTAPTSEFMEST